MFWEWRAASCGERDSTAAPSSPREVVLAEEGWLCIFLSNNRFCFPQMGGPQGGTFQLKQLETPHPIPPSSAHQSGFRQGLSLTWLKCQEQKQGKNPNKIEIAAAVSAPETQPLDGEGWRLTPSTAPQCKRVTCKGAFLSSSATCSSRREKQTGNHTLLQTQGL